MVVADIAMRVTIFRQLDSHKCAHDLTRCLAANQTYLAWPAKPEVPVANTFMGRLLQSFPKRSGMRTNELEIPDILTFETRMVRAW